jgi:poly-gamma-glutamate synthesis protein (capsule biosynthesis protein)
MLAARLAESGADAIIGHHPHVLQPIDTLGQSFVFYSLGNFVFDQHPPMTREGMMVNLHFHSDASITYDTIRVQIKNNRPTL